MKNKSFTLFVINNTCEKILPLNKRKKLNINYCVNFGLLYNFYIDSNKNIVEYDIGGTRQNNDRIVKWISIIRNPLTRFVDCFNNLKNANIMREKQDKVDSRFYQEYSYKGFKLFNNASELLESLSLDKKNEKYIAASKIIKMNYINNGYYYEFKYYLGKYWLERNAKNAFYIAVFEDSEWFEKLTFAITGEILNVENTKLNVPNLSGNELTTLAKHNYYNYAKSTEYDTLKEFVKLGLLNEKVYNSYIDYIN